MTISQQAEGMTISQHVSLIRSPEGTVYAAVDSPVVIVDEDLRWNLLPDDGVITLFSAVTGPDFLERSANRKPLMKLKRKKYKKWSDEIGNITREV